MLKRIRQFKKLWTLTGKDPKAAKVLESLSEKDLAALPSRGNGKAVFMPEMTAADLEKYNHEHRNGWKKFNDMVRKLTP
jgi:hypothetical protein